MKLRIALLTSAIAIFATAQASADLAISNGSFEFPDSPAPGLTQISPPGGPVADWTAFGPSAFIGEPSVFPGPQPAAVDGDQYLQLNANGGGRISQLLGNTDPASLNTITVSGSFAERTDAQYTWGLYSDAAGDNLLGGLALVPQNPGDAATGFVSNDTVPVTVGGSQDVYLFINAVGASGLFFVDNLSISITTTAIPEPGSLSLLSLGALGLVVVRRRRRR